MINLVAIYLQKMKKLSFEYCSVSFLCFWKMMTKKRLTLFCYQTSQIFKPVPYNYHFISDKNYGMIHKRSGIIFWNLDISNFFISNFKTNLISSLNSLKGRLRRLLAPGGILEGKRHSILFFPKSKNSIILFVTDAT